MFEAIVARSFEALNQRDLGRIMRQWADNAIFEFPGHTPVSGRFVGKPAIEAWWTRWVDHMASVHFDVKTVGLANPFTLTLRNTCFVEWHAEVTTKDGISMSADAVSVLRVRRGKVVYACDYFFDPTVLDAVWGRTPDAVAA
jgi:ketosteroid isomerase-like protein